MVARNRIEIRGTLAEEEVWSTGVVYGPSTTSLIEDAEGLQTWAEAIHAELTTLQAVPSILFDALGPGSTCKVLEVAAQYYGPTGGIVNQGVAIGELDGTGNVAHPPQVAVCFSMRTGLAGRSRRGRNYWPGVGAELNSIDLRLSTADAGFLAAAWGDLIETMGDLASEGTPLVPSVYSPTLNVLTPVSQVLCGDVLDTQRRRRDALLEAYSTYTLA